MSDVADAHRAITKLEGRVLDLENRERRDTDWRLKHLEERAEWLTAEYKAHRQDPVHSLVRSVRTLDLNNQALSNRVQELADRVEWLVERLDAKEGS